MAIIEARINRLAIEKIRTELASIRKRHGRLTPQVIVEEATNERHPLHRYFEWDDAAAAHQHRLQQAMHLVRCVQVTVEVVGEKRQMRELVSVTRDGVQEYMPIVEVAVDGRLRDQVIERAKMEIDGWTRRYETYEAYFRPAFVAVKAARKKFPKSKKRSGR